MIGAPFALAAPAITAGATDEGTYLSVLVAAKRRGAPRCGGRSPWRLRCRLRKSGSPPRKTGRKPRPRNSLARAHCCIEAEAAFGAAASWAVREGSGPGDATSYLGPPPSPPVSRGCVGPQGGHDPHQDPRWRSRASIGGRRVARGEERTSPPSPASRRRARRTQASALRGKCRGAAVHVNRRRNSIPTPVALLMQSRFRGTVSCCHCLNATVVPSRAGVCTERSRGRQAGEGGGRSALCHELPRS